MKKIIIGVVALLVIVLAVMVFYVLSNLNSIVAEAIEKNGTEVTGTSVSVTGVDLSLREGRGSIKGLNVASPGGFTESEAFSLGDITVDIDIKSIREEPIIIEEVRISAPVVNAEILKDGKSNIDELRKRVNAYTAGSGGGGDESGSTPPRIRINKFVFEKGKIEMNSSAIGIENRSLNLPEIRLNNVGGQNGAPPDEITKIILSAVAKQVASEIAGSEVNRLIKEKLGGSVTDKAKGLLDKIGN